jgi:hypothetical protein
VEWEEVEEEAVAELVGHVVATASPATTTRCIARRKCRVAEVEGGEVVVEERHDMVVQEAAMEDQCSMAVTGDQNGMEISQTRTEEEDSLEVAPALMEDMVAEVAG